MVLPPFESGAVHVTVACASPAVALTAVGAPGVVNGVTLLDASDGALDPATLAAVTVNVYAVPLVRPVTVALVGTAPPATDAVTVVARPPGVEVTV
jgi:hypothetical protein